jgi:hypothetical protein
MDPALKGFLLGLAVGVVLVLAEYYFVKKDVAGRATAARQHPEFEPADKARVRSVFNFSLFLPPAFAVGAWLLERFMT